jgi:hypothetical protein
VEGKRDYSFKFSFLESAGEIGAPDEGSGKDFPDPHVQSPIFKILKTLLGEEALDRPGMARRRNILPDGKDLDSGAGKVRDNFPDLLLRFSASHHEA